MNLSDFVRGYANAASNELIEEMFDWFYNSKSAKTENPNRITRKDLQKWVPVGTPLYNKIQQVKFTMLDKYLTNMIHDVKTADLEEPPRNKLRKVIFKDFTGLTMRQKLVIVGQLIGRDKLVNEEMIYQCMIDLHGLGKKITVTGLARLLNCSPRTIYRSLSNDLKREKELLNKDNEKV